MIKKLLFSVLTLSSSIVIAQSNLDYYIINHDQNQLIELANVTNQVISPVDIDFHPDQDYRPNELWVLNQGTDNSGGSTVIIRGAHADNPTTQFVQDGNAWHFMALPSALAFSEGWNWATSQDILDANRQGGNFTGPTLWTSELTIYGIVGNPPTSFYNGSHLDMLHQSPYGKGIAHEVDNTYWVMDGFDGTLKRYNFKNDHGPGQHFHGDGEIQVYTDFSFERTDRTLPQHIEIDEQKKWLYGCDTKGKRIFRVDITTGEYAGNLTPVSNEPLAAYHEFTGATVETIFSENLISPTGIDVFGNRLIVTDNGAKQIIIYNLNAMSEVGRISFPNIANISLKGIKVGPDGKIYFIDAANRKIYRLENNTMPALGNPQVVFDNQITVYPNPASGILNVKTNLMGLQFQLFDVSGKLVKNGNFNAELNQIDVSSLNQGFYFLSVTDGLKVWKQKIAVLH